MGGQKRQEKNNNNNNKKETVFLVAWVLNLYHARKDFSQTTSVHYLGGLKEMLRCDVPGLHLDSVH